MELKFLPQRVDVRFAWCVLVYHVVTLIIFQVPLEYEAVTQGQWSPASNLPGFLGWPLAFLLINGLLLVIAKKRLAARVIGLFLSALGIACAKFVQTPQIIDPVYWFIIGTSCAAMTAFHVGRFLDEQLEAIRGSDAIAQNALDYIRDAYKYILARITQAWIAFAASLGVSMSILFRSGYDEPHLKFVALKMFLGFVLTSFGLFYWGGVPALNGVVSVQQRLQAMAGEQRLAAENHHPNVRA